MRWYHKALLILFTLIPLSFFGQSTNVTFTVQDGTGQIWAGGTVRYFFAPAPGTSGTPNWQGAPLPSQYYLAQTVTLDNTGKGSFTVPSNTAITPAGSTYTLNVCPNATAMCTTLSVGVTGPTLDISNLITSSMGKLTIPIQPIPKAYADAELQANPNQGGIYYNTGLTTPGLRYWNGAQYNALGGGGSSGITSFDAPAGSWPTWLVPSPSTIGGATTLGVTANPIPNAALQYSSISVNGSPWSLGGTYTLTATATPAGPFWALQSNSSAGGSIYGDSSLLRDSAGDILSGGYFSGTSIRNSALGTQCHLSYSTLNCEEFTSIFATRGTTSANESETLQSNTTSFFGAGRNAGPVPGTGGWTVAKNILLTSTDNVRGIDQTISVSNTSHSEGDKSALYVYNYTDPGCGNRPSDEGCNGATIQNVGNGNYQHVGTMTGGTNTSPTLSFSGPVTDGGYLIDTTATGAGVIATAATNNAGYNNTFAMWSLPVTAASVPVSTAIGIASAAIPDCGTKRDVNCSATVTVAYQTIGAGTPALVPGFAVIAGPGSSFGAPEQVTITAVSGTSVTLSYNQYHASGFSIFQGGLAGYAFNYDADLSFFNYRPLYIALGSLDGNSILYCGLEFGHCNMPIPRTAETPETATGAIHLYHEAEVVANLQGGGIEVEANPWFGSGTVSHNVEANPGPMYAGSGLFVVDVGDAPCYQAGSYCRGISLAYQGKKVSGAYIGMTVRNGNPCSLYTACDSTNGVLPEPLAAYKTEGYHQWNHYDDFPSLGETYVNEPTGTGKDYTYGLYYGNSSGAILKEEVNQSNTTNPTTGVYGGNTSSLQVGVIDFITQCHHEYHANTQFNLQFCPITVQNGDGAGEPDITLNAPTNGTAKWGLVANAAVQFNNPVYETAIASIDCIATDSSGKHVPCSNSNIQITTGTTALGANACSAETTATLTGVATTSTINFTATSNISTVVGWGGTAGLKLFIYPSAANTIKWYVCNQTAASITPGANVTWNVSSN